MIQSERYLEIKKDIPAPLNSVWMDWTTQKGIESFFAPFATVELKPGGKYELYFSKDEPEGSRGSETCKVLNFIPEKVLFFTWNNPPLFPEIRFSHTFVMVRFIPLDENNTRIILSHYGWGVSVIWDKAYEYFQTAWNHVLDWNAEKYKPGWKPRWD